MSAPTIPTIPTCLDHPDLRRPDPTWSGPTWFDLTGTKANNARTKKNRQCRQGETLMPALLRAPAGFKGSRSKPHDITSVPA